MAKRKTRPTVPGGRQISFWGSIAEGEKYDRVAKKAGMTRSKWLRRAANRAAK